MYLWDNLQSDINELKSQGARVFDIGYTVLGRPIQCVVKGNINGGQTLIQACTHAREWVTTPLVMQMMKNYNGSGGVWCVPMVNIDGALLAQQGLSSIGDSDLATFLRDVNGGSENFGEWKANARAVDINVNFFARWGEGAQNVNYPSPGNYIGAYPESEPETRALVEVTKQALPSVTLSYHARGEVIYKGFGCVDSYQQHAAKIANVTGYPLENSYDSAGGYKDWYVATTTKLGLTIEVGNNTTPYPQLEGELGQMLEQNKNVLDIATAAAIEIASGTNFVG